MLIPSTNNAIERFLVCVVAPFPPPYGGMSLQAEKLSRLLTSEGIDVIQVPANPTSAVIRRVENIPVLRTIVREAGFLLQMIAKIRKAKVIHHLSASGVYFALITTPVVLAGKLFRKKILLNYRGGLANEFLRRWSWLAVPLLRWIQPVFVPSEFLKGVFLKYGIDALILPNIAEIQQFPYQEKMHGPPRLLVTRHLEPEYNIACIIRAFQLIQHEHPDAVLTVAGTGSEERNLKKQAEDLSLANVIFRGYIPSRELPQVYAEHSIFLNASNIDNFPGALVEAACSGLPIVTTRAGGIPDMIQHRENGLLVEMDDHEAMAAAVTELVRKPQLSIELAGKARTWAEQFSWDHVFANLLECYGIGPKTEKAASGKQSISTISLRP